MLTTLLLLVVALEHCVQFAHASCDLTTLPGFDASSSGFPTSLADSSQLVIPIVGASGKTLNWVVSCSTNSTLTIVGCVSPSGLQLIPTANKPAAVLDNGQIFVCVVNGAGAQVLINSDSNAIAGQTGQTFGGLAGVAQLPTFVLDPPSYNNLRSQLISSPKTLDDATQQCVSKTGNTLYFLINGTFYSCLPGTPTTQLDAHFCVGPTGTATALCKVSTTPIPVTNAAVQQILVVAQPIFQVSSLGPNKIPFGGDIQPSIQHAFATVFNNAPQLLTSFSGTTSMTLPLLPSGSAIYTLPNGYLTTISPTAIADTSLIPTIQARRPVAPSRPKMSLHREETTKKPSTVGPPGIRPPPSFMQNDVRVEVQPVVVVPPNPDITCFADDAVHKAETTWVSDGRFTKKCTDQGAVVILNCLINKDISINVNSEVRIGNKNYKCRRDELQNKVMLTEELL